MPLSPTSGKIVRTESEWRTLLDPLEYAVTREGETERAFTGRYWNYKGKGIYRCVCCAAPLFSSETKYDSGSGWPSFHEPVPAAPLDRRVDRSHGMARIEARCGRCDAHLGHVFDDGPPPSGMRYCINSASLRFEPAPSPG